MKSKRGGRRTKKIVGRKKEEEKEVGREEEEEKRRERERVRGRNGGEDGLLQVERTQEEISAMYQLRQNNFIH